MKHAISLGVALLVLWLLLSGLYDPLFIGFGVVSMVLVVWLALRMGVADREGHPIHLGFRAWRYWPWLLKEIARANLVVARQILSQGSAISPCTFTVRASQRTDVGRTTFANSITLTPGTVSTGIDGDQIRVHALTEAKRDSLLAGEMNRRVTEFEGDA